MLDDKSVMSVIRAARPTFRNRHDKVVFAVHAAFLASGYVLTAVSPASSSDALSSSNSEEVGFENWNEAADIYAFVDANPNEGGEKVLLKCLVMGDRLTINALGCGDFEPLNCEINVQECAEEEGRVVVPGINLEHGGDLFPGPGAGIYPTRGRFDGDMILGPNDPRWGGTGSNPRFPGGGLPGVPPGARFDPYGPPGVPGFEHNRFVRHPRRPPGSHHPDLGQPGPDPDYI